MHLQMMDSGPLLSIAAVQKNQEEAFCMADQTTHYLKVMVHNCISQLCWNVDECDKVYNNIKCWDHGHEALQQGQFLPGLPNFSIYRHAIVVSFGLLNAF